MHLRVQGPTANLAGEAAEPTPNAQREGMGGELVAATLSG